MSRGAGSGPGGVEIAVIDYGRGNLRSVQSALARVGARPIVTADPARLLEAPGAILPGVGSFRDAMSTLRERGFVEAIREYARQGRPILGICLGLQLFFERADEGGPGEGLGLLEGHVAELSGCPRLPHIGWNLVRRLRPTPLLPAEAEPFYFVHSYGAVGVPDETLAGTTEYGATIAAVVQKGLVMGTQFHPERSGAAGLAVLGRFTEVVRQCS
ncbi:MAG TPA: imidazole glycerol phosphate synthase subunit HisH [Bacillota bacterium]